MVPAAEVDGETRTALGRAGLEALAAAVYPGLGWAQGRALRPTGWRRALLLAEAAVVLGMAGRVAFAVAFAVFAEVRLLPGYGLLLGAPLVAVGVGLRAGWR